MHGFLDVLNRLPFESQRDVVETDSFQWIVPENAAVGCQREEVAVAAGVNDAVANDDGDIFVIGGADDAGLQFGAPEFLAGLRIDRGDLTVATNVKVLFHSGVVAATGRLDDYNSIQKFHR